MIIKASLVERIRVLTLARLLIAAFLVFYAQYVFPPEAVVFYGLIAIVTVMSIVYMIWLQVRSGLKALAWLQIAIDLALESILIGYTGGTDSLFASIFVLSILSAGFVISGSACFVVAVLSSFCFTFVVFEQVYGWVPMFLAVGPPRRYDANYLFYATYVRVSVFFIVAFLSFYFSGMIVQLQEKVRAKERLAVLGEIISDIAHEIRNPLASVSGSVELLAKRMGNDSKNGEDKLIKTIVEESSRIRDIFNGLLDYARLPTLNYERVMVDEFLDRTLELIQYQDGYNENVQVDKLYQDRGFYINLDPELMKQALTNILINSYQAMPNGGSLEVDCIRKNEDVIFRIKDTGTGMDKNELSGLFTPFKTSKQEGTGLGMARSFRVVNQHGGQIEVRSAKGKGTEFEVWIPRHSE